MVTFACRNDDEFQSELATLKDAIGSPSLETGLFQVALKRIIKRRRKRSRRCAHLITRLVQSRRGNPPDRSAA